MLVWLYCPISYLFYRWPAWWRCVVVQCSFKGRHRRSWIAYMCFSPEDTFIFPSRVRPWCICDIYDFFVLHINVLTYLYNSAARWNFVGSYIDRKVHERWHLWKLKPEIEFHLPQARFEFLFGAYLCPRSRYFHKIWCYVGNELHKLWNGVDTFPSKIQFGGSGHVPHIQHTGGRLWRCQI